MTEVRGVNVDIQFPQLRAYLPSRSICSPHVADGQQRQEKCEFDAATVLGLSGPAGPLLNDKLLDFPLGHISFF